LIVAGVRFACTPEILRAVDTPPQAQALALAYLPVIFAASPFMFVFMFLTMILRGAGDARTPFRFMLLSVVLDVAINPLLSQGSGPSRRARADGRRAGPL
jgi:Na+-driven multidrug efflux pump